MRIKLAFLRWYCETCLQIWYHVEHRIGKQYADFFYRRHIWAELQIMRIYEPGITFWSDGNAVYSDPAAWKR